MKLVQNIYAFFSVSPIIATSMVYGTIIIFYFQNGELPVYCKHPQPEETIFHIIALLFNYLSFFLMMLWLPFSLILLIEEKYFSLKYVILFLLGVGLELFLKNYYYTSFTWFFD